VREGRTPEFCFDTEGTATRNNEGVAVAMNREFFALLTALREMRVTPRVVSIAGNDEDEDDDERNVRFGSKKYPRQLTKLHHPIITDSPSQPDRPRRQAH
jgi:hypothetical protein